MNNNRGWGLSTMLWLCAAILVFFCIAVFLLNQIVKRINDGMVIEKPNIESELITPSIDNNTIIGNDENKVSINYSELENELTESASKYALKYSNDIKYSDSVIVTIVRLKSEMMTTGIFTGDDVECSGYVVIKKSNIENKYNSYINCGEYKTAGYNAEFDNLNL